MGSNSDFQRGLGGAQIAGGAALTAMGQPALGVPLMMGGVQSEVSPDPNRGPLNSMMKPSMDAGMANGSPMDRAMIPMVQSAIGGGPQAQPPMPSQPMQMPRQINVQNTPAPQTMGTSVPQMQPPNMGGGQGAPNAQAIQRLMMILGGGH